MSEREWLGDIPDTTDRWLPDRARFETAATDNEAENAGGADTEAEAPAQEGGEQPRDEQGRFAAKPDAAEEATAASSQPDELILGKFRTVDDLAKSYENLERHTGSLREEVGQLRQAIQQPPQPQPQFDLAAVLEESPSRAAEMAYRSGNQQALEHVLSEWDEVSPGAKDLWLENKQNALKVQQMEAKYASLEEPIRKQQSQTVLAAAYDEITRQYPDFEDHKDEMAAVAADLAARNGQSFVDTLLQTNNPATIAEGFEYLYLKSRGLKADNLSQVSKQLAAEHAQNVQQAKQEAAVASSSTSSGETPAPSAAKLVKESWDKLSSPYASGPDGWNV